MTNGEWRMTKEARNSKSEIFDVGLRFRHLSFVILSSFVIRHSSFVVRA